MDVDAPAGATGACSADTKLSAGQLAPSTGLSDEQVRASAAFHNLVGQLRYLRAAWLPGLSMHVANDITLAGSLDHVSRGLRAVLHHASAGQTATYVKPAQAALLVSWRAQTRYVGADPLQSHAAPGGPETCSAAWKRTGLFDGWLDDVLGVQG